MIRLFILSCFVAILSACGHNEPIKQPDPVIITKYKYVMMNPPSDSLTIPPAIKIPKDPVSDKDISILIVDLDGRMTVLEEKLKAVSTYLSERQKQIIDNGNIRKEDILE